MTNWPRHHLRAALMALSLVASMSAASAETVTLPHGLIVDLPDGWHVDGPDQGQRGRDGLTRIQLVCESEACRTTQETCTILLRDRPIEGADDAEKLRSLYRSPFQRYWRLRAVLRATSRDAEILAPLDLARIGQREWYRVETDARHNHKSGLFAETVLNGLYVGAICKTCETGEIRHRDGQRILASLKAVVAKPTALLSLPE